MNKEYILSMNKSLILKNSKFIIILLFNYFLFIDIK